MTKKQKLFTQGGVTLIAVICVSVLVSITVNFLSDHWLDAYRQDLQTNTGFTILSTTKPTSIPGTFEDATETVRKVSGESIALLQIKTPASVGVQDWLSDEDALGTGVVATTDGWILFHQDDLPRTSTLIADYDIRIGNNIFEITEVVIDPLTSYAMVKILASDLQAIDFADSSSVRSGAYLFAVSDINNILVTSLIDDDRLVGDIIDEAEILRFAWKVDHSFTAPAPLLSANGSLLAFTDASDSAIPLHTATDFISSVIAGGTAQRAGLGAYVVDLDSVFNIDQSITNSYKAGALIYSLNTYTPAVVKNGPADLAELERGDVILSVESVLIEKSTDLAELLAKYSAGDTVTLQIGNKDGLREVDVVLSNIEDLVY